MANSKLELLKKAKAGNMLTADELDGAAGGAAGEMASDSQFLNRLLQGRAGCPNIHSGMNCLLDGGAFRKELTAAWASVGITANLSGSLSGKNIYMLDGREITRQEAIDHANQMAGQL